MRPRNCEAGFDWRFGLWLRRSRNCGLDARNKRGKFRASKT